MNKLLSLFIHILIWFLLILFHSLILGEINNATPYFWRSFSSYYSVWIIDLYIILLYYVNYFLIAPAMIRHRLFSQYVALSIIISAITLALPIVFYHAWKWTIPGITNGHIPIYFSGFIASIAAITVGLSVRGVREWIRLDKQNSDLRIALNKKTISYERAEARLRSLQKPIGTQQKPSSQTTDMPSAPTHPEQDKSQ